MSKKVPMKTINSFLKEYEEESVILDYYIGDSKFSVEVKPYLTISEINSFVDRVVSSCFSDDGDYYPELKEPVFQITLMQFMTNLPVPTNSDDSKTVNVQKAYDIMFNLDIELEIRNTHRKDVSEFINSLRKLVNEKIEFRKEQILKRSKFDDLCESLEMMVAKWDKNLNIDQLNQVYSKLSNLNLDENSLVDTILKNKKSLS